MRDRGLEPFDFSASAWAGGSPRVFGATTLFHPEFAARTANPLWGAGFTLIPAPAAGATTITMMTPADVDGAWTWATELAEALSDAVEADVSLMNGFTMRPQGGVGSTPAGEETRAGSPPGVLLPWMYFGATRLSEDRLTEGLASLSASAFRSAPTEGSGWVLQAREQYDARPPSALLDAYEHAFDVRPRWVATK